MLIGGVLALLGVVLHLGPRALLRRFRMKRTSLSGEKEFNP
jgi:hypothetical protein